MVFGFAWYDLSDADLKKINDFRADKSYMYKDATMPLPNGISLKIDMPREDNHFVVLFEYGNSDNKQVYWRYEHLFPKNGIMPGLIEGSVSIL